MRLIEIRYSKEFNKNFKKVPKTIIEAFNNKIRIFERNFFDPFLNNHKLLGKYSGFRSINITADWRALYTYKVEENTIIIVFKYLGTHSELYG